jgi:hypothetical protein
MKGANTLAYFLVFSVPFSMVLIYTYYHGIIDHSGITFKRYFWQPWQPDCIFHDNHHQGCYKTFLTLQQNKLQRLLNQGILKGEVSMFR